MELKELLGTRTIDVPWGDNVINVTYRLGERTATKTGNLTTVGTVVDAVVLLVESWDITVDGKPVPIEKDELDAKVPITVLRKIATYVLQDDGLGEASRSSDAG